jgi:hypothetical protein
MLQLLDVAFMIMHYIYRLCCRRAICYMCHLLGNLLSVELGIFQD